MTADLNLNSPVRYLKGVGPRIASLLSRVGVETVKDLIYLFPRDYVDRRSIMPISRVGPGEAALVMGVVTKVIVNRTRRGFTIIKAAVMDRTGVVHAAWFNQPFMMRVLKRGVHVLISGKAEFNSYSGEMEISVREWELVDDEAGLRRMLPKYPLTEGLYQKTVRKLMEGLLPNFLPRMTDPLPDALRKKLGLMDMSQAIGILHFPDDPASVEPAHDRLAFDDFFFHQLGMLLRRKAVRERTSGVRFEIEGRLVGGFLSGLPFDLTSSQRRVLDEIFSDLASGRQMLRLLQGDVGSGKTVVAAIAAAVAVQSGHQVAMMVPTEILAAQHKARISVMMDPLGVRCEVLVSSVKPAEKRRIKERAAAGEIDILIGTHALLEEDVAFRSLGLIVIDEQHRFGVLQREKLIGKGSAPSVLVMTATPIPRSLALTLFGDLDRSVIDELPPGRTPVQTVHVTDERRARAYEFMRREISLGRQVFVVCPLIEESEASDIKAAKLEADELQKKVFSDLRVGLLHGRLRAREKEAIMRDFVSGRINILVSTTVIEVGIDIPNASIMLVEHAERFGLSQLHQLRGRIGRGAARSYCLLAADPRSEEGRRRIAAMLSTSDGFKIAEEDLKIRGPGDFCGTRQSGLPVFRVADIINDHRVLTEARRAAVDILASDPTLALADNMSVRRELKERHGAFLKLKVLN